MAVPFKVTINRFETQWQTNYLAPFHLVKCLLPILQASAGASNSKSRVRIVNVSSHSALTTAPEVLDLARPNLEYITGAMAGW